MQYTQHRSPSGIFGPDDYVWAYSNNMHGWLFTPVRMVERDWGVKVPGLPNFIAWMPADALPIPTVEGLQR